MKKALSVLLIVCTVLTMSLSLTSCFHKCEFSDEWSRDKDYHWHACKKEKCTEVADKEEHTWDEGELTTVASQEEDGTFTYTCTVCKRTKAETVPFEGMTSDEWYDILNLDSFENFEYTESSVVRGRGTTTEAQAVYKFKKNRAQIITTIAGKTDVKDVYNTGGAANTMRTNLARSIIRMASHSKYEYDAETKTYKAIEKIYISELDAYTSDVTLTFADNRLVGIKYSASFEQQGFDFEADSTITISNYGTVVIE